LSTGRPALSLSATASNLTLRWPLACAGFVLQSRTNLAEGAWVNITSPAPQIIGEQWVIYLPVPIGANSIFYRLFK
jgi:TRAP-type C4-dicarboxylate transport system permease small subunit